MVSNGFSVVLELDRIIVKWEKAYQDATKAEFCYNSDTTFIFQQETSYQIVYLTKTEITAWGDRGDLSVIAEFVRMGGDAYLEMLAQSVVAVLVRNGDL